MRTYVMLAAPRRLLLLGDRTIRALLPAADSGSRVFNHDGGTLPVFATFHPRLLLGQPAAKAERSEEHTSELQSLMRISYAVFCLKKKKQLLRKNHRTEV